MTTQPNNMVLNQFGIRVVAVLGGRLNQHWLVETRGERLVLRRWARSMDDAEIDYEVRLMRHIAALGWPVAPVIAGPIAVAGHRWSLAPLLPGDPPSVADPTREQRARGRLLAALHVDLAHLQGFGQRGAWRRCEDILADPLIDRLFVEHEQTHVEEVRILRWHLERARARIDGIALHNRPGMVIHGDFTSWNLRVYNGRLSGILDFELAHWDHRIADFALAWRGTYDAVIHGYIEVAALEPVEWELLTPVWWAWLIEGACRDVAAGTRDDGWTIKQLLRRSALMGPDAMAFR